jgi:uncharacterized protein YqfB (UPF0267 family)
VLADKPGQADKLARALDVMSEIEVALDELKKQIKELWPEQTSIPYIQINEIAKTPSGELIYVFLSLGIWPYCST